MSVFFSVVVSKLEWSSGTNRHRMNVMLSNRVNAFDQVRSYLKGTWLLTWSLVITPFNRLSFLFWNNMWRATFCIFSPPLSARVVIEAMLQRRRRRWLQGKCQTHSMLITSTLFEDVFMPLHIVILWDNSSDIKSFLLSKRKLILFWFFEQKKPHSSVLPFFWFCDL